MATEGTVNLPVITHCYCGTTDHDQDMLKCDGCLKFFHKNCLKTGFPSNLAGDVFYHFTCILCAPDQQESCRRMQMKWTYMLMLVMYNLQLKGTGMAGFLHAREHITVFIDKNWNLLFGNMRKKTPNWKGTVAGALSSGKPQYFKSRIEKGDGWWILANFRPPTLEEVENDLNSVTRKYRTKRERIAETETIEAPLETRRRRSTNSSLQAAIELKERRSIIQDKPRAGSVRGSSSSKASTSSSCDGLNKLDAADIDAEIDACSRWSEDSNMYTMEIFKDGNGENHEEEEPHENGEDEGEDDDKDEEEDDDETIYPIRMECGDGTMIVLSNTQPAESGLELGDFITSDKSSPEDANRRNNSTARVEDIGNGSGEGENTHNGNKTPKGTGSNPSRRLLPPQNDARNSESCLRDILQGLNLHYNATTPSNRGSNPSSSEDEMRKYNEEIRNRELEVLEWKLRNQKMLYEIQKLQLQYEQHRCESMINPEANVYAWDPNTTNYLRETAQVYEWNTDHAEQQASSSGTQQHVTNDHIEGGTEGRRKRGPYKKREKKGAFNRLFVKVPFRKNAIEKPKKKLGRPRKVSVTNEESPPKETESFVHENADDKSKNKGGRPRKNSIDSGGSRSESADPKKKLGRPRKDSLTPGDSLEPTSKDPSSIVSPNTLAKKRGRPKGSFSYFTNKMRQLPIKNIGPGAKRRGRPPYSVSHLAETKMKTKATTSLENGLNEG